VDKEYGQGQESVYTNKVRAGKRRTYFFDVRKTKGEDFYLTLTESTKRFDREGYTRHKLFLYKEDFNRFIDGLQETINHVKHELMPDYDYEQFDRRQEEWEKQKAEEAANAASAEAEETTPEPATQEATDTPESDTSGDTSSSSDSDTEIDEDMSW